MHEFIELKTIFLVFAPKNILTCACEPKTEEPSPHDHENDVSAMTIIIVVGDDREHE